jgi:type II restriction/modification system DNA methylase subunit YeeA
VHVSLIGFDDGSDKTRLLDGKSVATINANLSAATDITQARILSENQGIACMGDTKVGPFEIPETLAREWLPLRNPNGKPNADVVRPWANGLEVTRTSQGLWIVDFPPGMSEREAAQYETPFEYVRKNVKPLRAENKRRAYAERWWIHAEARPEMRVALNGLSRYLVTPTVAKHRVFVWLDHRVLPDHQLIVFAREDDYFFGVLHLRPHEVWALTLGTRLETARATPQPPASRPFPFPGRRRRSKTQSQKPASR